MNMFSLLSIVNQYILYILPTSDDYNGNFYTITYLLHFLFDCISTIILKFHHQIDA